MCCYIQLHKWLEVCVIAAHQRSVCLATGGGGGCGVSCAHYPWCIGPHCTGLPSPQTWDLTVPSPPPGYGSSKYRDALLVASGGHHSRSVQTCSLQDPPPYWYVVAIEAHTVGASGRYTSYWNAFLFIILFDAISMILKQILKFWNQICKEIVIYFFRRQNI